MLDTSVRTQTYIVVGVIVACFSFLYPKIFHPMIASLLGLTHAGNENSALHKQPQLPPQRTMRPHPSVRTVDDAQKYTAKSKTGIMAMILPIYAVGIILYLIYTLSKVFGKKKKKSQEKKDEFLREYYGNFHYDVNRGSFRMDHHSSSEDEAEQSNLVGQFDWSAAYGDPTFPNIYRSAKSLPRDLERLLEKMDEENINTSELSQLRARLEQTEHEMSQVLRAMRAAEKAASLDTIVEGTAAVVEQEEPLVDSAAATSSVGNTSTPDEEEDLATASEDETDKL